MDLRDTNSRFTSDEQLYDRFDKSSCLNIMTPPPLSLPRKNIKIKIPFSFTSCSEIDMVGIFGFTFTKCNIEKQKNLNG